MDIYDILDYFAKKRYGELTERFIELKDIKHIEEMNLDRKKEHEQKGNRIKTGTLLDEMMGGGLLPKESIILFGEFGSGKSQTCLSMMIKCENNVILIDAENSVSATRLEEIAKLNGLNWDDVKKKIHI